MPVGQLAGAIRADGHLLKVISPFAYGAVGYDRVMRPHVLGQYDAILRHATAVSRRNCVQKLRQMVVDWRAPTRKTQHAGTMAEVAAALDAGADILLISAYTMYRDLCVDICAVARQKGVRVLVGGPMFVQPDIARDWLSIPGLSALFIGEPDQNITDIMQAVMRGEGDIDGLHWPGTDLIRPAAPLRDLDALAFADYSDFPWHKYPSKIVPMMTGRGCSWGVCTFCSDVLTSAGRSFRSRSLDHVLGEIAHQHGRFNTSIFNFIDLKLNSDLDVWRGLASEMPSIVPDAEWTASLHVNRSGDNGLSRAELKAAKQAGLSRVTTGLESGSGNVLNAMAKGTSTQALSQFVRYASEVGLSVRMTAIIGYPGETPEQVDLTGKFVSDHHQYLDRVIVNRLALSPLTPIWQQVKGAKRHFTNILQPKLNPESGLFDHVNTTFHDKNHRRAVYRLLRAVHRVNRKPLIGGGLTFEGVF